MHAGRDVRGRPTYVSRNFTGSRRQAETFQSKLVADVDRRAVRSLAGTVATLLEAWLADIEPDRSIYTMREHRRSVELNLAPALGPLRLDRLTAEHLDRFYGALRAQGLGAASVRRHHDILSSALRRAVKWGWLTVNPADAASPPGPAAQPRPPIRLRSSAWWPPPKRSPRSSPPPSPWPPSPRPAVASCVPCGGPTSTGASGLPPLPGR